MLNVIPVNLKKTQISRKKTFPRSLRHCKFNLHLITMLNFNLELLNRDQKWWIHLKKAKAVRIYTMLKHLYTHSKTKTNFKVPIKIIMQHHRCLNKKIKIVLFISNFLKQKLNMKSKWMKEEYNSKLHSFKSMKKRQYMIITWHKKIKRLSKKM